MTILFKRSPLVMTLVFLTMFLSGMAYFALAQGTGETTRVSVASDGSEGSYSFDPAISSNGRYIAFESDASNLVANDTNGTWDVFVHDQQTSQTTRVSVSSTGSQGSQSSLDPVISGDGRYVAFMSEASNLVSGDTNYRNDVFVHDRLTGQTTRVSVSSTGSQGSNASLDPVISGDGRYVAFQSSATNLIPGDTNGVADVFVHDRQTGQTARVSVASDGMQGNQGSSDPSISGDGRYIAFQSSANNLVSDDTNDQRDIFVHDRQTGQMARVSVASDGMQGNDQSGDTYVDPPAAISGDGRYIAFLSKASNLVPGDTNGVADIFVHDQQTGQTRRVSVASDGMQGNNDSYRPNISGNGRYVAFQSSASNLVSDDTNDKTDTFVYDRQTGQTTRVSVASSGAQGDNGSSAPSISEEGRYVAFQSSASNLVSDDTNGSSDIFVRDRDATLPPSQGTITGHITDPDSNPLGGITVQAYQLNNDWTYLTQATTNNAGNYTLADLTPGSYRLHFIDTSGTYFAEYYNDHSRFDEADEISVTSGSTTDGIDASLTPVPPPETDIDGDVSVGTDPDSGEIVIRGPRGKSSPLTLTLTVLCADLTTPTAVTLLIGEKEFAMTDIGDNQYQVTLTVPDELPNKQGPFEISVRYDCSGMEMNDDIGRFELYDPSGHITDAETGEAIAGAAVNLYRVPNAFPDSGGQINGSCRTVETRPDSDGGPFGAWSGLPATALNAGAWVDPQVGLLSGTPEISPTINPQITGSTGGYGWDVVEGCWYVVVQAPGYESLVSPLVGVPPEVTDLDVALSPSKPGIYLPIVVKN